MSWRDLLAKPTVYQVPWVGDREMFIGPRRFRIEGPLPTEEGWASFISDGPVLRLQGPCAPRTDHLMWQVKGYLVGDHLVFDAGRLNRSWCPRCNGFLQAGPAFSGRACGTCHAETVPVERVHLLEPLERFSRISAGRLYESGPLIFVQQEMPLGPEEAATLAYEDRTSLDAKHVTPELHAAFAFATHQRTEVERRRAEAERRRLEAEARRQIEERRAGIVQRLGDAAGRREMARIDFPEAARAALAVGGAEFLDTRPARKGEHVVRFRFLARRFECVCNNDLGILDAGICLNAHGDDEFEDGTKGDTWFTLESLPSVIKEAHESHRLVVFRHAE